MPFRLSRKFKKDKHRDEIIIVEQYYGPLADHKINYIRFQLKSTIQLLFILAFILKLFHLSFLCSS